VTIGAHELRERFGYWMDRAAEGAEIVVTRHGRPRLRLTPAPTDAARREARTRGSPGPPPRAGP
jgi:prevent-host-death family protein